MPTADHLPATITSTSPCIIQVIDTAELLENVLLYLDLRTLLFAKHVSQRFRDTMEGSIKIQRALFFQPMVHPTVAEIEIVEKHNTSALEPWDEDNCPAGTLAIATPDPFLNRYVNYELEDFLEISVTHVREDLQTDTFSDQCILAPDVRDSASRPPDLGDRILRS